MFTHQLSKPLGLDTRYWDSDSEPMPDSERPNFTLEAVGESKQTISTRLNNALMLELQKQLAKEKEMAAESDWPAPTMTDMIEMLLKKGLRARKAETTSQQIPTTNTNE